MKHFKEVWYMLAVSVIAAGCIFVGKNAWKALQPMKLAHNSGIAGFLAIAALVMIGLFATAAVLGPPPKKPRKKRAYGR